MDGKSCVCVFCVAYLNAACSMGNVVWIFDACTLPRVVHTLLEQGPLLNTMELKFHKESPDCVMYSSTMVQSTFRRLHPNLKELNSSVDTDCTVGQEALQKIQ